MPQRWYRGPGGLRLEAPFDRADPRWRGLLDALEFCGTHAPGEGCPDPGACRFCGAPAGVLPPPHRRRRADRGAA